MTPRAVVLSTDLARRVADATRRVEQDPGQRSQRMGGLPAAPVWQFVKPTAKSGSHYTGTIMMPSATLGTLETDDAVEIYSEIGELSTSEVYVARSGGVNSSTGKSGWIVGAHQPQFVYVLNSNASPFYTVRKYDPVYIGEPTTAPTGISDFPGWLMVNGGPNFNSTGYRGWGIADEAIALGAVGRVRISGVSPVRLDPSDVPDSGDFNDPWPRARPGAAGLCYVDRNGPFEVIWKEEWDTVASEVWALVQILNYRGLSVVRSTATPGTSVGDYVTNVVDLRFDADDFNVTTLDGNADVEGTNTFGAIVSLRDGLGGGVVGAGALFGTQYTGTTTNNTETTIGSFTLADDTVYNFDVRISGRRTNGDAAAVYFFRWGAYRRSGGSATAVGVIAGTSSYEIDSTWDANISLSGNDLKIKVTGATGHNVNWTALLSVVKA